MSPMVYAPPKAERNMPLMTHAPSRERSARMRLFKSKGTKPELEMAAALHRRGLRPSRNVQTITGRPDFCWKSARVAVFIDSDFWHGRGPLPKTNVAWWAEKFRRARRRDQKFTRLLKQHGWTVLRFSVEEVRKEPDDLAATVALVVAMRKAMG